MPSILKVKDYFRTLMKVLNLIITGMPSILFQKLMFKLSNYEVLNLIITGMPSIPMILLEY